MFKAVTIGRPRRMQQRIVFAATLLLGEASGLTATAQPGDSIRWKEFSYIKQSEAWFRSENAAGLARLPVERISMAETYFEKQNGGFCNYSQSENSYNWGAKTESFYRLSPRIVLYGQVAYDNFTGKQMGGSVFIHPEEAPFDIVEYSDENRGEKNLESYHLTGAVSGTLSKRWTLGAKVDFTAANYAKAKDLRHQNKLLDMYATAGATYSLTPRIDVGAAYYYRRSTEGVDFDTYGTTDKTYTSLISYGAFFGQTEVFGENGYTKENEEKPLFNEWQGGSLQLGWQLTPHLAWYNEWGYKSRDGYYGKKSPYTVVYSNHKSDSWNYNGTFSLKQGKDMHQLNLTFQHERLRNFERIYRTESQSGGSSDIVYYGTLDTTEKTTWNVGGAYAGYFGVTDYCPVWILKGGVTYFARDTKASVYPYYRKQHLGITDLYVSTERNWVRKQNRYKVSGGMSYRWGDGEAKNEGTYATPSESQPTPSSMDAYLYKEYEFLTARQVKGEIGLSYARIWKKRDMQCQVSLRYEVKRAFQTEYLGNGFRHEMRLAIGCTF